MVPKVQSQGEALHSARYDPKMQNPTRMQFQGGGSSDHQHLSCLCIAQGSVLSCPLAVETSKYKQGSLAMVYQRSINSAGAVHKPRVWTVRRERCKYRGSIILNKHFKTGIKSAIP